VSDTLGNGLNETMGYSARGIPQSYSSTPYSFALGLAANGTITSGNDSANGNWTYGYDQFNRLVSSSKSTAPAQGFSYVYDRNGNRLQQNVTQGTGPNPQYTFDNNNRIAGSGVTYDALGNIQTDGLGNTFTYDAESRLIKVVNSGGTYNYTYDADGRRVRNNTTEFLYDLSGRAITLFGATDGIWNYGEIYAGGRHLATYSGSTTNFLHSDWLGTKRVMSSISGTNSQSCTSLPFGDGSNCTGTEWNFNHFTDDIHDSESNLEHTWFRQLSGTQGRWTIPDPYRGSMDFANPQSLNRYNYGFNSPTTFFDPYGLDTMFYFVGGCLYSYESNGTRTKDGYVVDASGPTTLVGCLFGAGGSNAGSTDGSGASQGKASSLCQATAPAVPLSPPGANVNANVKAVMEEVANTVSNPDADMMGVMEWWLLDVKPGGPWDYKQQGSQYTTFGNFNFGATCNAMGMSLETCQRGAGFAAHVTSLPTQLAGGKPTYGPGNPLGSPAYVNGVRVYGDQPGPMENDAVINGWVYQQWQNQCSSQAFFSFCCPALCGSIFVCLPEQCSNEP